MANPQVPVHGETIESAWGADVVSRGTPVYATVGERDTAQPNPEDGQVCAVAGVAKVFRAGAWRNLWEQQAWTVTNLTSNIIANYGGSLEASTMGDLVILTSKIEKTGFDANAGQDYKLADIPAGLRPRSYQYAPATVDDYSADARLEARTDGALHGRWATAYVKPVKIFGQLVYFAA